MIASEFKLLQSPRRLFKLGKWIVEDNVIGTGFFSFVTTALDAVTLERVAMKWISKRLCQRTVGDLQMRLEYQLLSELKHPNIIELYQVLENEEYIILIIEFVQGGDLLSILNDKGRLSECEARSIFQQLVAALQFAHHKRIYHRDIKLENVFLTQDGQLKLGDWGFACKEDVASFKHFIGSRMYCPPEVLMHACYPAAAADMWASGVVLFILISGYLPFGHYHHTAQEYYERVFAGDFDTPDDVSGTLKSLLCKLLNPNPLQRPSPGEICSHSWVQETA